MDFFKQYKHFIVLVVGIILTIVGIVMTVVSNDEDDFVSNTEDDE